MARNALAMNPDTAFERKLRRTASLIKTEADGQTCGDCAHGQFTDSGLGYCERYDNIDGASLAIYSPRATACKRGFRNRP